MYDEFHECIVLCKLNKQDNQMLKEDKLNNRDSVRVIFKFFKVCIFKSLSIKYN